MIHPQFKIHSIALCKNEADVIVDCLEKASEWSDYIYVYDGCSTDGTWELVQELAERNPRIIAWRQDDSVFRESLRADVYHAHLHLSAPGDWWCQLNVDEYYPQDPRALLKRISDRYHVVWGINVEYKLTESDIETLNFEAPFAERREHMRFYRADYSEIRFFRQREGLVWKLDQGWPTHLGPVYPERICFLHYPYRSPKQIQMRLDVRREHRANGFTGWEHASQANWREKLERVEDCDVYSGDGNYEIRWKTLPAHQPGIARRLIQRFMHGVGLWP